MLRKQLATFLLVLLLVCSSFYLPVFTPKAQAFLGIGDIIIDIKRLVESIVDAAAMNVAQKMVNEITNSTIRWANTGFQGGPSFVTNRSQFFGDVANGAAGEALSGVLKRNLCTPFKAQVVLSLQKYETAAYNPQCTLTGIENNLQNFYNDFSQGGWDSWYSVTQGGQNPYNAFLDAKIQLDNQTVSAVQSVSKELDQNQGFKSFRDCIYNNPSKTILDLITRIGNANDVSYDEDVVDPATNFHYRYNSDVTQRDIDAIKSYGGTITYYDDTKAPNDCIGYGDIKTPGAVIKDQLDHVLPSGLTQLINVQHVNQLISAVASGLLQRFVFGSQGLFASKTVGQGLPNSGDSGNSTDSSPIQCTASSPRALTSATLQPTSISWHATNSLGLSTTYSWSGDEFASARNKKVDSSDTASVTYDTPGAKQASLIANITDSGGNAKQVAVACKTTVIASQYNPLSVSCSANVTSSGGIGSGDHPIPSPWDIPYNHFTGTGYAINPAKDGAQVIWTAKITGGSGNLSAVSWSGKDGQDGDGGDNWEDYKNLFVPIKQNEVTAGWSVSIFRRYKKVGDQRAEASVADADPYVDSVQMDCSNSVYTYNSATSTPVSSQ